MVETVRMHPLLVTASKDIEIGTARFVNFNIKTRYILNVFLFSFRWKQMSVHDIVTECAKYSLLECQDLSNREDMICSSLVHSSAVFIFLINQHFELVFLSIGISTAVPF